MTYQEFIKRPELELQLKHYRDSLKKSMTPEEAIIFLSILGLYIAIETRNKMTIKESIDLYLLTNDRIAKSFKNMEEKS